MEPHPTKTAASRPLSAVLAELEERSRARPDRVLRLRGSLPAEPAREPFELLIFRGFSSLTTHPTDFDPDRPALPEGSVIDSAELLQAPLIPDAEILVAGAGPLEALLGPDRWP